MNQIVIVRDFDTALSAQLDRVCYKCGRYLNGETGPYHHKCWDNMFENYLDRLGQRGGE